MEITWRDGTYKYRTAKLAYVNNVRVAAITWQGTNERFNVTCLLPGEPSKMPNVHRTAVGAVAALEERINNWFELVKQ